MRTRMTGTIGFHEDIVPLVPDDQRDCMQNVGFASFDLHDWQQVKDRGPRILERIKGTTGEPLMPPEGWPATKIQTFENWVEEGSPKYRSEKILGVLCRAGLQDRVLRCFGPAAQPESCSCFQTVFQKTAA